jgi:uncharacterized protein (DUF2062 family)
MQHASLLADGFYMSRLSLKKLIPSAETLKHSKSLRFLGKLLDNPNLFHMNRRSVSKAFFWGVFIGLLPPVPVHTPAAATAALITRSNLPLTIAVVWISNPITIPIIMFAFYHLGRIILQLEPAPGIEFSWAWLYHEFEIIWKPYLVGSLVGASVCAVVAYMASNYIWRLKVKRKWQKRKNNRALIQSNPI